MALIEYDETIQRGSIKEYISTTIVESFGITAVLASAGKLALMAGMAYSIQEMSEGKTKLTYNPKNGMTKLK